MPPQAQQFLDTLNSTIPLEAYLIVGAIMFAIGAWGALIRRNAVVVFMCIELMINAVNLSLVAFADYLPNAGGAGVGYAVLVIAGDVRPDAAFALAERLFGGWAKPAGPVPAPTRGKPTAPPAQQRVVVIDVPDAEEATVTLAVPAVGMADADYFRALVSGAVLGGGYGARLSRAVRVERPLAESLRAWVDARRDAGTLYVSASVPGAAAAEAAALLAAGMAKLAAEPATDEELALRRAFITGTLAREAQTTEGLATAVGMLAARGVPLDRVARFGQEMQSVTPRDVQRFGTRLAAAKPQVVIVGRADAVLEDARRRFPGVEVVPFDELDLGVGTLRSPQS